MRHWLRLITVALFIATAHAADRPPLRIGWTAWSDAEAVTRLAARVLETRLDQPVELVLDSNQIVLKGRITLVRRAHSSYM